jgi:hypothetical protein
VLDDLVWSTIVGFLKDPTRLLAKMEATGFALDTDRADTAFIKADLERQLVKVQSQRSRLLDLYLSESITRALWETKDAPLKQEEQRLQTALHQATSQHAQIVADSSRHREAVAYCKLIAKGVDHLDEAGRRQLLQRLIDRVLVAPDRIEIQGRILTASEPIGPNSAELAYRCGSHAARDHGHWILGFAARRRRQSGHRPVRLHARCAGRPRRDVDDDPDRHLRAVHATAAPTLRRDDDLDRGTAR